MQRQHVQFELDDNIGVITLNRPEAANAQSPKVLEELDEAWNAADADTRVKVIVLKSNGKHFSAGHDLGSTDGGTDSTEYQADALYDWETRHYLRYAKSWRNIPKPSIAAVQGKCIAAGLMLCWPCDLIVAADNAEFSDPVLHMGILGVEMHAHTWELGPRKAKELLFTAGAVTAEEARQLGMVNKVVPLEQLVPATMEMARRIARNGFICTAHGETCGQSHDGYSRLHGRHRLVLRHAPLRPRTRRPRHRRHALASGVVIHERQGQELSAMQVLAARRDAGAYNFAKTSCQNCEPPSRARWQMAFDSISSLITILYLAGAN